MVFKKKTRRHYTPRSRRFHRVKDKRIPILPVLAVAAPVVQSAQYVKGYLDQGDAIGAIKSFADQMSQKFTGLSVFPEMSNITGWHPEFMFNTYLGLIAGFGGSKLATMFGANKALKRVPFIGKYVKL